MSTSGDVQNIGGYHNACGGYYEYIGDVQYVGGYHKYIGRYEYIGEMHVGEQIDKSLSISMKTPMY